VQPIDLVSPGATLRRLRGVLAQAKRDLAMISTSLRGELPPPTVTRDPRPRHEAPVTRAPAAIPADARSLRVTRVVQETSDAVSLFLADASGAPLTFEAGQFLTFLLEVGGDTLRRSYSLSSSPLDGPGGSITVKRIEGGRASTWLNAYAREGMTLAALGPQGGFVVPARTAPGLREVVLFAGGSGITPCLSIARTVLRTDAEARVSLTYGSRDAASVLFREAIAQLRAEHGARFAVQLYAERPGVDPEVAAGRVDRAAVVRTLAGLASSRGERVAREFFVCGPGPMMEGVCAELEAQGVPGAQVHVERFSSPDSPRGGRADLPPQEVVIALAGRTHALRTARGQTILDAATDAGVALPFSCAVGGCGACKAKLVEGTVDVETPNCLTREERAAGYVLTCVGRATSACRLDVAESA
jgi:ring-1,2-phenylacetyl-CoA epoxidase subunit PaaE